VNGIDELKQHLIAVWDGFGHSVIDNSIIDEWCGACVCANWKTFSEFNEISDNKFANIKSGLVFLC